MGLLSCSTLAFLVFLIAGPFSGIKGRRPRECPEGWIILHGSCYGFFISNSTWDNAQASCEALGPNGHLVTIDDEITTKFMAEYIKLVLKHCVDVWIGLHDPEKNGGWRWINTSSLDYKSWMPGKPNSDHSAGEHCAVVDCGTGYTSWNVEKCDGKHPYLCQHTP